MEGNPNRSSDKKDNDKIGRLFSIIYFNDDGIFFQNQNRPYLVFLHYSIWISFSRWHFISVMLNYWVQKHEHWQHFWVNP